MIDWRRNCLEPNNKLLSFLGLARKAQKLSLGKDAVIEAVSRKKSKLILLSSDLSNRTMGDVIKILDRENIKYIVTKITMDQFSVPLGKRIGIISVDDENFANKLSALTKETDMEGFNI